MTVQVDENLIYEGEKASMMAFPEIKDRHPRIVRTCDLKFKKENIQKSKAYQDIFPADDDSIFYSTACDRHYIGTWEIKDARLYLVRIDGYYTLLGNEPLFADWYSGKLLIPKGKLLCSSPFFTVHEKVLHVSVVNGQVIDERMVEKTSE